VRAKPSTNTPWPDLVIALPVANGGASSIPTID